MKPRYQIRFDNESVKSSARSMIPSQTGKLLYDQGRTGKSKLGCRECKLRRVKCDETFPVCLKCQRRGSVCHPGAPPPLKWQAEIPSVWVRSPTEPWTGVAQPDKRLLNYWFTNTSRMMALRSDGNPLSFPLVEQLLHTPSLLHAVQSISAGQENFFHGPAVRRCLEQRSLAIEALRREVADPNQIKPSTLLSVFLLGVSSSWSEERPRCYGKEHLSGARALLNKMLSDKRNENDPVLEYIVGWYLYWDMSCSYIADPEALAQVDTFQLYSCAMRLRHSFHSMIGFSAELFYYIANIGRHCREVIRNKTNKPDLEAAFEEQLLKWDFSHEQDIELLDMSMAYRNHGLLMLYTICRKFSPLETVAARPTPDKNDGISLECAIRQLALDSLRRLLITPPNASCIDFHSMPMLTAAAELRKDDARMRVEVSTRYKALFSKNRIVVNLWAVELLEELWELRDSGVYVSWLELVLSKDWCLNFA